MEDHEFNHSVFIGEDSTFFLIPPQENANKNNKCFHLMQLYDK